MSLKGKPRVGDKCWEVEWCTEIPVDENGDSDMDRAKLHVERFQFAEEAMEFARDVFPQDQFGAVAITLMQFCAYDDYDALRYPHAGFWDAAGETYHYEGEEAEAGKVVPQ